jgi:hypothetical protein
MLCFGVGVPAWAQFETRATNPFPQGAFSVATGDFNNDGRLDVVMKTDNGFSVALGNGDGTFQKAVTYTTQLAYSLAVADFNGDGKLDIVVANENEDPSTVSVYLGNGDGTFQAPIDSNTTDYNEFVAVGDFNGDGKPDIVVIENPSISVLLGNGDGTFQPPSDNNSFVGAHLLAVGDFNNDRELDVIVAGYFGSGDNIGVLLGNGDGTLQDSLTSPLEYQPFGLAAGQLGHSGNLDAVVGYIGAISVLLGNGDGTFQPQVYYDPTGLGGGSVTVADLNLDGKMDVATSSGPPGMDVFWGNGDGTLQPAQFFSSGMESGMPVVGDFNSDGLPDFALGNDLHGVITMLNTGRASFSPSSPVNFSPQLFDTMSAPQIVALKNLGTAALSIRSIKASGQFKVTDTCGASVAPGTTCTISAVFQPTSAGTRTGLITIMDSASAKPQFIELRGTGTVVKVAPGSLVFADQKVGTKSTPQVVTVTNEGGAPVQFAGVGIGGTDYRSFSEIDNCTSHAIAPGATCQVSVTFRPKKAGARAGLLSVTPTGTAGPAPVALSGTGD